MTLLDVIGIAAIVSVSLLVYRLLKYPHIGLPDVLTVTDLARIESAIEQLISVTVIAHRVEDPQDELRAAVKYNLRRGVQYRFLVSDSSAEQEINGYYKIFEVLANIAQQDSSDSAGQRTLVSIQALPYDWREYPYVFYEIRDAVHGTRFIAIRGTQKLEGIADYYSRVEPAYAHMIARAVLSDGPQPITVNREQFNESNVVPFASTTTK